jgi:hypothetical protein
MKQIIMDLADKAIEDMPKMRWEIPDEFCEKFAELIVKECDRYARSVWEHGPLLGRDLLIHFGIEEMSDE